MVVVAIRWASFASCATALTAGPLANVQTLSYGIEGVGIVDVMSGLVTPVPIVSPPTRLTDAVFNGLAVSADGAYVRRHLGADESG